MAAAEDSSLDSTYLYSQLDNYPWDEDQEFQGGLKAILGSSQNQDQLDHLTLRAKCYYYARKSGTKVDFEGYKRWVDGDRKAGNENEAGKDGTEGAQAVHQNETENENQKQTGSGGMGDAPKPASFAEICELIAEGKPIPGIKDIPDTVLEGQSSESQTAQRKKPWERAAGVSAEKPSWMK